MVSYVKKEGNKIAHKLAHWQPLSLGRRTWVDGVPDLVANLALDDLYDHITSNLI